MPTDFRGGRVFPRPARERFGGYDYLLRVFDKGRAARDGTIFDYVYPCPIDQSVFGTWGITSDDFDAALERCTTEEQILAWVQTRVPPAVRDAANAQLAETWTAKMDKHDRDEAVVLVSATGSLRSVEDEFRRGDAAADDVVSQSHVEHGLQFG